MVKSMTGFGRARCVSEGIEISVEIRSVNHRFFECTVRVPRSCGFLEDRLKKYVNSRIFRGKIDIAVTISWPDGDDEQLMLRTGLAKACVDALRKAANEMNLTDDLKASDLLTLDNLFAVVPKELDEDALWNLTELTAEKALDQFCAMRQAEGNKLLEDVSQRLDFLEKASYQIESLAKVTVDSYRERLTAKMQEVLSDRNMDESRVLTEAAIYADKIATDEETVRLRSHIGQFRTILAGEEPAGRKLDFLVQECNREVNTIGSKCCDLQITNLVLECKAQIEKIREQIQNIE